MQRLLLGLVVICNCFLWPSEGALRGTEQVVMEENWSSSALDAGNRTLQTNVKGYKYWNGKKIHQTLRKWTKKYSNLVQVTTAQDAYRLPRAGSNQDCPFDQGSGCLNYILTIQDFVVHPPGSLSSKMLPEVLWSGELHGDERVGPTVVMEAAQLLLDAAKCERLKTAGCLRKWKKRGYSDANRRWLARLVTTRRIVVVPTANAVGYHRNQREEGGKDPNRDFGYQQSANSCMETIAARTLNEVALEHMFQLSLTFHGGIEMINYMWGTPAYGKNPSPDDISQKQISDAYARHSATKNGKYRVGRGNVILYAANGVMEDWMYAASWDKGKTSVCRPNTYGGYDAKKTNYHPGTLRTANILVEISNDKFPSQQSLGSPRSIFSAKADGYVSRNVRLALVSADLVEPYVQILSVNGVQRNEDLVPLVARGGRLCQDQNIISVPSTAGSASVQFIVGGGLSIDDVAVYYAKWSDVSTSVLDCVLQPDLNALSSRMTKATITSDVKGSGQFAGKRKPTVFSATVNLSGFSPNDQVVVIAAARVDSGWGTKAGGATPSLPPQSHIANVRTNAGWRFENAGKIIQGRLYWFSLPQTVNIV